MQSPQRSTTPASQPDAMRGRLLAIIKRLSFARRKVVLASGRESDFYIDMKPTMFDPEGASLLAQLILRRLDGVAVDCIGGLEMGAVPLVACVSAASFDAGRPLPGFFVRKNVKDHGTRKLVEGVASLAGKTAVILEDVTTTGGSAIQAVAAARAAGGDVALVLSIVDRQEGAAAQFVAEKLAFDSLFTAADFIAE